MKFIIFADKSYNYVKPLADGLHRTLMEEGHECHIWYDGNFWLNKLNMFNVLLSDIYKLFQNIKWRNNKKYIYRFWNLLRFYTKEKRNHLQTCDCIIVVNNCPSIFYSKSLKRLESLRSEYKKPIVNLDFHYLPNQAWWKRINQTENPFGLERFDWYLPVALVTEFAIPREIPQIYSSVGLNLQSSNLYPQQEQFQALIDFPRKGYEAYEKMAITALESLGIPYVKLNGRYTRDEIRKVYRKSSIYFVSFRESFGLPICELQLCGAYVFTPYAEWCPAHFLGKDIYEKGSGELGRNFVVYDNDIDVLKEKLSQVKESYSSQHVLENFKEDYPYYYEMDKTAIKEFVNKLANGTITSNTHKEFKEYNKYMSLEDDIVLY